LGIRRYGRQARKPRPCVSPRKNNTGKNLHCSQSHLLRQKPQKNNTGGKTPGFIISKLQRTFINFLLSLPSNSRFPSPLPTSPSSIPSSLLVVYTSFTSLPLLLVIIFDFQVITSMSSDLLHTTFWLTS